MNNEKRPYIVNCKMCKTPHIIQINPDDVERWQAGALAQDAFPYLTPDEREMLISGWCEVCWKRIIGEDE